MTVALPRPVMPWLGAALGSIALGIAIALNLQVAFLVVLTFLGVAALAAPAGVWVLCALVAALTFRGLVEVNTLPSVATFVDLPLAWGALAVGLLKQRERSPFLRRHLWWLGALALAVALAWVFHPSEVLRPVLYLALLGEPFAIVGALLADPPSPRVRRALQYALLTLLLLQIPLAALQLATLGLSDHIQGTLYGAGAAPHVISATVLIGGIWVLSGGFPRDILGSARFAVAGLLFAIPFLADAKQVILALPVILFASTWRVNRFQAAARVVLVACAVVLLLSLMPAGQTATRYLQQNEEGQGGKQAVATFLLHKVDGDPAAVAFGHGPAETVSRAALLMTPIGQRPDSVLPVLDLRAGALTAEAQSKALDVAGEGGTISTNSTFNSGTSSALGVLGDLGIVGLAAYVGLVLTLLLRLRKEGSAEGGAAAAGFALLVVLGLVFDWWEQPPFSVFVSVLAGLALTATSYHLKGGHE
jgi:hypothetical protein